MSFVKEFLDTNYRIRRHRPPHQPGTPVLRADNVSLRYEGGVALENVSFELQGGERVAVVGPNGAGKSTLFKIIAGVLQPTEGRVHVYGQEPDGHICIAYIPQRSQVDWDFPVNVADVVMMGRVGQMGLFRHPAARDWEIVHEKLEIVNLRDLAHRQIGQLSGGQQQRMFIARALAQEAGLMLLDEPLTGLDVTTQQDILCILDGLRQHGVTVLMASHDLKLASERFDRVMLLNHRMLGFGRAEEVLDSQRLIEAYGGHLHVLGDDGGAAILDDPCGDEGVLDDV
jgi:manganese/iron transport system ATP-binding protein